METRAKDPRYQIEPQGGEDFEQVARAVDPELKNEYLSTSPSRRRTPSSCRIHGADPTALHP